MCPHIKVAELNTLSDGKGITGIHIAFFDFSSANLRNL